MYMKSMARGVRLLMFRFRPDNLAYDGCMANLCFSHDQGGGAFTSIFQGWGKNPWQVLDNKFRSDAGQRSGFMDRVLPDQRVRLLQENLWGYLARGRSSAVRRR